MAQAEGASHGQDEVADLHPAALAQPRGDQSGRLDGQHGDVGIGIVPHFARIDSAPVGQVDLDPVGRGAADDVAVGQHVVLALTADNDAGAGLFGVLAAAVLETGAVSDVGLDVDDGGPDELGHRLDHGSLLFEDLGLLLEQPVELFAFLLRDRSPALDGGLDGSLGASLPRAEDAQQEPCDDRGGDRDGVAQRPLERMVSGHNVLLDTMVPGHPGRGHRTAGRSLGLSQQRRRGTHARVAAAATGKARRLPVDSGRWGAPAELRQIV